MARKKKVKEVPIPIEPIKHVNFWATIIIIIEKIGRVIKAIMAFLDKEALINFLIQIVFWILLFVYLYINITFYIKDAKIYLDKIATGLLVGSIEICSTWLLFISANISKRIRWGDLFKKESEREIKDNGASHLIPLSLLLIVYLGLSIPSQFSKVGFIIEQFKEKTLIAKAQDKGNVQNTKEIDAIDINIDLLKGELKDADSFSTNKDDVKWYKNDLVKKIKAATHERGKYSIKQSDTNNVAIANVEDTYSIVSAPLKVTGIFLFMALLIIRLFFLDVCIILIIFLSYKQKTDQSGSITNVNLPLMPTIDVEEITKKIIATFKDKIKSNEDIIIEKKIEEPIAEIKQPEPEVQIIEKVEPLKLDTQINEILKALEEIKKDKIPEPINIEKHFEEASNLKLTETTPTIISEIKEEPIRPKIVEEPKVIPEIIKVKEPEKEKSKEIKKPKEIKKEEEEVKKNVKKPEKKIEEIIPELIEKKGKNIESTIIKPEVVNNPYPRKSHGLKENYEKYYKPIFRPKRG